MFNDIFGGGDEGDVVDFGPAGDSVNFDEGIELAPNSDFEQEELIERLLDNPEDLTPEQLGAEVAATRYTFQDIESAMNYVEPAPMNVLKIYITPQGDIEVWRFPSD